MKQPVSARLRRHARLIGVVALLLLLFVAFESAGWRERLSLAYWQQTLRAHPIGGLLVFTLGFTLGNLVQIPGWIFLAAAVLALGPLWGGVATYVAACTACFVVFFMLRTVGGPALRKLDHPLAARLLDRLDAHPVRHVALLRMLFQTLPALNYTLALSGIRFRAYALGTLAGLPLPIALYCVFFDRLAALLNPA